MLSCAGHWPPKWVRAAVISAAPSAGLSRPVFPFEGRYVGGGSCRILLFFGLAGILSSSRYITGTLLIAIQGPFVFVHVFNQLSVPDFENFLQSGIRNGLIIQKTIGGPSVLALWTVMCAPAGKQNAADGCAALAAGLAGAQVDAMLELEETADAVGVDIIGDRRAARAGWRAAGLRAERGAGVRAQRG